MDVDHLRDAAGRGSLSEKERADLLQMREEERLARDLYRRFYEAWGVPIFGNIADSEQRHHDAIGRLLKRYGIADPSSGRPPGAYADPDLQRNFDDWLARGLSSVEEAYTVGYELETADIADLSAAFEGSDQPAVRNVYENLRAASDNHLRAFEAAISDRAPGRGRGRRRGGRGRGPIRGGCHAGNGGRQV